MSATTIGASDQPREDRSGSLPTERGEARLQERIRHVDFGPGVPGATVGDGQTERAAVLRDEEEWWRSDRGTEHRLDLARNAPPAKDGTVGVTPEADGVLGTVAFGRVDA